jgi:K+/H+ antiporter YhaU regulatory subunit KhtT
LLRRSSSGQIRHRRSATIHRVTEAELLRRLDQTIERNSQVIELNARAFERLVGVLGRLERRMERLERTVDDLRDQIAANTQALLRLIDRLGPVPDG